MIKLLSLRSKKYSLVSFQKDFEIIQFAPELYQEENLLVTTWFPNFCSTKTFYTIRKIQSKSNLTRFQILKRASYILSRWKYWIVIMFEIHLLLLRKMLTTAFIRRSFEIRVFLVFERLSTLDNTILESI